MPSSTSSAKSSPAPEPTHLAMILVVPEPDRTAKAAEDLLGSRGGILTSRDRVATLAVELGLPASTIELFPPNDPVVCAVITPDTGPSYACATHVRDPVQLVTITTRGASPAFSLRHDAASSGDVLVPSRGGTLPLALGLFRDHLVAAPDEATLLALGPWLDESFVARIASAPHGGDVAMHVHGPMIGKRALGLLTQVTALLPIQARAALDPEALVGAILAAPDIDVVATVTGQRLGFTVASKLPVEQAPIALGRGLVAEALGIPSGAEAALTIFERREDRVHAARDASLSLEHLVEKEDATALSEALSELATARGDRSTLGFELGARGPALFGDLAIVDSKAADHALGLIDDALARKSVKHSLHDLGYSFGSKRTVRERVGDVNRIRIARAAEKDADAPPSVELLLRLEPERLVIGGGYDAGAALDRGLETGKLRDEPRVRDAIARAPKMASLVLFADVAGLVKPRAHTDSTAFMTVDVDPDAGDLRLTGEIDAAALCALLDLGMVR